MPSPDPCPRCEAYLGDAIRVTTTPLVVCAWCLGIIRFTSTAATVAIPDTEAQKLPQDIRKRIAFARLRAQKSRAEHEGSKLAKTAAVDDSAF